MRRGAEGGATRRRSLYHEGNVGDSGHSAGGKLGNAMFIRTADGYIAHERVVPANRAGRGFGQASQGWRGFSDAEFAAWEAFALPLGHPAYNIYQSLTRKWLAVHPMGVPPTMPPGGPFFRDAVRVLIADGGSRIGSSGSTIRDPRF